MKTNASADRLFKALADPTRIRLLNLLAQGELCVCDLMSVLRMGQSRISRHLAYLKRSGLVLDDKRGLWRYYRLASAQSPFHQKLLDCLTTCLDESTTLQRDETLLKKLRHAKTPC